MRAASGTRWGHAPSPLHGWWYPHPLAGENLTIDGGNEMSDYKLFVCVQCGFEYDEAKGWPEDGIAPGTRWDDIPEDWSCPDCGAAKSDFEMVEVARS